MAARPGTPWWPVGQRSGGPVTLGGAGGGGGPKPAPAPSPLQRALPVLNRDPQQDPRTRRVTELVSQIINSLVAQGYLKQISAATWTLVTQPAPTVVPRLPTIFDDSSRGYTVGTIWVQSGIDAYILLDGTAGAALWSKITP